MRIGDSSPFTYTPQSLLRTPEPPKTVSTPLTSAPAGASSSQEPSIGQNVKEALNNVNSLQHQADGLMESVATGKVEDVHKAMVAMEHAMLSLDFTLQVRNKALEAYQEIMKTQL